MLPLLAVVAEKVTPLEKLQNVSGQFWIKIIIGACVLAGIIFLLKKVMAMNKIILSIIICVAIGVFAISWVYNRDEPAFLTPIIAPIADSGFFPTKGVYEKKQTQDPTDKQGKQKSPTNSAPSSPTQPAKK
jgi:hypothetical protein